jgi:hypothetical protein
VNLEVVALQVQPIFLENVKIIWVETKHNPIKGQKLVGKVKNRYNVVLILPIPWGNFCKTKSQRNKQVPITSRFLGTSRQKQN